MENVSPAVPASTLLNVILASCRIITSIFSDVSLKKRMPALHRKFILCLWILAVTFLAAPAQQCSPLSTFDCAGVVKNLPVTINFSGGEGGLMDKNMAATGFTIVDKPSAPLSAPTFAGIPGYEPANLEISSDRLTITTTAGISYLNADRSSNTNSQVNALGVGFLAPSKFTIQTSLVKPDAGTGKSEQAGLWFGLDEDNYVKFIVVSAGGGKSKIELRKEADAVSDPGDGNASAALLLSNSLVDLKLEVNKVTSTVEGFYSIDGADEMSLGTLSVPHTFIDGKILNDGVTRNITLAGIFATHRNADAPLTFTFENFNINKEAIPVFQSLVWDSAAAPQEYDLNEAQTKVINGKFYSFGGVESKKACCTPTKRCYIYDPVADTWTKIADLPYLPNGANFGGITHAGIATNDTDIFIAGGYTSTLDGKGQIFGTKQVYKYIVAQDKYISLPDLPIRISAGQLEYLNNKLYYIGGTNFTRSTDLGNHYMLDLNNLAAGWDTLPPLPNPRHHTGSVVYGGKIYIFGGLHGQNDTSVCQKDVHVFDPLTKTWTKLADLPVPGRATGRAHISAAVAIMGDRIFVLGGDTKHGGRTNLVSVYTPATNTWENVTALPRNRFSGAVGILKGDIYYFGGSNSKITYRGTPIYTEQQCSLISPFTCPEIVKSLPVAIHFTGNEGGLTDNDSSTTGFTMADKPSAPLFAPTNPNIPGYEPSKLHISKGNLVITTTAGISHLNPANSANTNSQVNALGVGFVVPPKLTVQTTLFKPDAGTGKSEQAGLWFGLDEDNYVKLMVVSSGNGTSKIEMRKETDSLSASNDATSTSPMFLSDSVVTLKIEVDKVTGTVEGFYGFNGSAEVSIGTLGIPESFIDGRTLNDGETRNIVFAGIFTSHRNAAAPITFSFKDFKVDTAVAAPIKGPSIVKLDLQNTRNKHTGITKRQDGSGYAAAINGKMKRPSINAERTFR